MFPIIKSVGEVLDDYLTKNLRINVDVFDFSELLACFTTNIISSVAFGIDIDCINDPDNMFRKMGAKIFEHSLPNAMRTFGSFFMPKLFHKLKFKVTDSEVEKFFTSMVKDTVKFRETHNYSRNDFLQLLIQLKTQGYVSVDKNDDATEDRNEESRIKNITMNQLTANVFLFFIGGKSL
jgi:cytochrome P450 family 6